MAYPTVLNDSDLLLLTLGSTYTSGASLVLGSGQGATLAAALTAEGQPAVSASTPLRITVELGTTRQIFDATALSTDTLTVASVQGSPPGGGFTTAAKVQVRWTAQHARELYTAADPNTVSVLRLPGGPPYAHVNHGQFWPQNATPQDLGSAFWWDAWVKPLGQNVAAYLVSDGYGGAHALLWGLNGVPGVVTGNVWDGSGGTSFGGHYVVAAGEWANLAVGWTGTKIYTYVNGVPDGVVAWAGPRKTTPTGGGPEFLYVGGSNHDNLPCDLAFVRGWDASFARDVGKTLLAYTPERFPNMFTLTQVPCDFAADYTGRARAVIADLSPVGSVSAVGAAATRHPGTLAHYLNTFGAAPDGDMTTAAACPASWLYDPTCPFAQNFGSPAPAENVPAPGTPPGGCKVFDSFGRRNQTFAFQEHPTLGSTEAGSLGPLVWSQGNSTGQSDVWGILQGAAVLLKSAQAVAWVEVGSADMDVRVDRFVSTYNPGNVALAFRVADKDHYWFAYINDIWNVSLNTMTAGTAVSVQSWGTLPGSWTTLRVTTVGNTITVYADGTTIGSITNSTYNSATKAGLQWGQYSSTDFNGLIRFKNFTVF